ncbi:MAG: hypothetical protein K6F56_04805 [Oscillospiraceae bacterium]|nr:hypothetical protein [Oscillospiraceae bacterium]
MKKLRSLLALILCLTLLMSLAPTAFAEKDASKIKSAAISRLKPPSINPEKDSSPAKDKVPTPGKDKVPTPAKTEEPAPAKAEEPAPAKAEEPAPAKDEKTAAGKDKVPTPGKDKVPAPAKTEEPAPAKTEEPAPAKDEKPTAAKDKEPEPAKDEKPAAAKDKEPEPAKEKEPAPAKEKEATPAQSKGPVITRQPEDQAVVVDKIAKFMITASGSNLRYQWQTEDGGSWVDGTGAGADKASFSFKAVSALDQSRYRCIVTDSEGSVTSDVVTLSIIVPPHIKTQPHNLEPIEDEEAAFTIEATGTDLQYRWQSTESGSWRDYAGEGADSPTLTLTATPENKGLKFRCIVSNDGGSVTSSIVVFAVKTHDEVALEEVQALTYAKSYAEAYEYAEDYFGDTPMKERDPKLLAACVHAYVLEAGNLQWKHMNEAAEALLESCIDTYKKTAAVKEAETALNTLNASLRRNEPASGTLLSAFARGSYSELTVQAGDTPVLVKLENTDNHASYLLMYVRAGEKGSVKLQDGTYTVRYAAGPRWYGNEELFGSQTVYFEGDETLAFKTSDKKNPQRVSLTLPETKDGKLSFSGIDPDDF